MILRDRARCGFRTATGGRFAEHCHATYRNFIPFGAGRWLPHAHAALRRGVCLPPPPAAPPLYGCALSGAAGCCICWRATLCRGTFALYTMRMCWHGSCLWRCWLSARRGVYLSYDVPALAAFYLAQISPALVTCQPQTAVLAPAVRRTSARPSRTPQVARLITARIAPRGGHWTVSARNCAQPSYVAFGFAFSATRNAGCVAVRRTYGVSFAGWRVTFSRCCLGLHRSQ